jgi:hypothetical protein
MPAAEITAAITGIRATVDLVKGLIGARDNKLISGAIDKIDMQLHEVVGKLIEAQKAQLAQLDEITALKAEIKKLAGQKTDAERYELKQVGHGLSAYMLKPDVRGTEDPHWLCPTCFGNGKKSHLQFSVRASIGNVYRCTGCNAAVTTDGEPKWL